MSELRILAYEPSMGEIKNFDRLKKVLAGKSPEEQRKYFYSYWYATRFGAHYYPLYELDRPVVMHEGIIVGARLDDGLFLAGESATVDERSDNNGAGYKEYIESSGVYFTPIPLDTTICHYRDGIGDDAFFHAHAAVETVIVDETVDELCHLGSQKVRYVGSLDHWLAIEGKSYIKNDVHLYLDGEDHAETTRLVLPEGMIEVYGAAFCRCVGLTEVVLPSTMVNIGSGAFSHCTGLRAVSLPDSVLFVHSEAFMHCIGLTQVRLPNSEFNLYQRAFAECTALRAITIPAPCKMIQNYAFSAGDEGLRIRVEAPVDRVERQWEDLWNVRYRDTTGSYFYETDYVGAV